MKIKTKIKGYYWFVIIVSFAIAFQSNITTLSAQETKQQKCEKLADCLENFYRDCYDKDYLDEFSPKLFDSFKADITHNDEMSRLDNFLTVLQNSQKVIAYIVVYGGRINKYGEYDIRVERITGYIFGTRAQDQNRVKIVHGGSREKFEFELWTSEIKNAFPPLSPTVAPEKVKFKGKMKPFGP